MTPGPISSANDLGAVRPGRSAAGPVQPERDAVLDRLRRLGRVAAATPALPGGLVELVLAAVAAAGRDRARVAAGLALSDPLEHGRNARGAPRAAGGGSA